MTTATTSDILAYGGVFLAPTRNPFNYEKIEQVGRDLSTSWLTLTEITNQLNLFGDDSQDSYLSDLELAVRMHIEYYLGLPIFPITFQTYYATSSLYGSPICLDLPEVSQGAGNTVVNSVSFFDDAQTPVLTPVSSSNGNWYYDPTGNKVVLASLPTNFNQNMTAPLVVNFTVKPSFLSQYPVIKQAGLLLLTHLYNNRSETTVGRLAELPIGIDALLRPYKPLVM